MRHLSIFLLFMWQYLTVFGEVCTLQNSNFQILIKNSKPGSLESSWKRRRDWTSCDYGGDKQNCCSPKICPPKNCSVHVTNKKKIKKINKNPTIALLCPGEWFSAGKQRKKGKKVKKIPLWPCGPASSAVVFNYKGNNGSVVPVHFWG